MLWLRFIRCAQAGELFVAPASPDVVCAPRAPLAITARSPDAKVSRKFAAAWRSGLIAAESPASATPAIPPARNAADAPPATVAPVRAAPAIAPRAMLSPLAVAATPAAP